jgi:Xaa-Pro dipeptidase
MDVAANVHEFQVKQGPEIHKLLCLRVGHGVGMEGHKPPFISLGDEMILEEGMSFSVEPGPYDPAHDFGYNPSDNLMVTKKRAF